MNTIRRKTAIAVVVAVATLSVAILVRARDDKQAPHTTTDMAQPIFSKYADLKWEKILPDVGADSPEISILRVDPKTQATQLMIRTPKGIHIRKHWHSANET